MQTIQSPKAGERTQHIDQWLEENNALHLATAKVGENRYHIYLVKGETVIIARYAQSNGWDAYITACKSNSIAPTITALNNHIGNL